MNPDQAHYYKNHHVSHEVNEDNDVYEFKFTFQDNDKNEWTWNWSYPVEVTDQMILDFGIPLSIFEPYYAIDSVIRKRDKQIKEGMFYMQENFVGPDMMAMVNYYRPFMEPIASLADQALGSDYTARERIELAMKFTQDIPYSIPPNQQEGKYTGGLFPPPQTFVNMFGDCDSKVLIFAGILSHYDEYELLILKETGHVLTGIKGIPKPYDAFYEYKNEKYIMAETAGPGRLNFGVIQDPYKKITEVQPMVISN